MYSLKRLHFFRHCNILGVMSFKSNYQSCRINYANIQDHYLCECKCCPVSVCSEIVWEPISNTSNYVRICVDYRKNNNVIVQDSYILPKNKVVRPMRSMCIYAYGSFGIYWLTTLEVLDTGRPFHFFGVWGWNWKEDFLKLNIMIYITAENKLKMYLI